MKIIARTKNGYLVDATLEDVNKITGLVMDKYGLGDTIEITPNLALAESVAERESRLDLKIATLKTTLESLSNG
ncbi:MAG: hypothetical protein Q7T18_06750 [Sedimentisphaerales bacterium]|nr:hypothetical protein [Sedimentisphaerales bacterium]